MTHSPNHPIKGSSCRVDPIKSKSHLSALKTLISNDPRNFALFVLGINTNLRASDLLCLPYGDVKDIQQGESFNLREKKTGKLRFITLNRASFEALQKYLAVRPHTEDDKPLFLSRCSRRKPITVSHLNRLVKSWCALVPGLRGNFGSHTLRKTFGYQHRKLGTDVPTLMVAFNHSSQKQTLGYLGINADEVENIFMKEI